MLSEDTTIRFSPGAPYSGEDVPLERFNSDWLEPGQCKTKQVQAHAQARNEGVWYLGAVADPDNYRPELIETNNTLASAPWASATGRTWSSRR